MPFFEDSKQVVPQDGPVSHPSWIQRSVPTGVFLLKNFTTLSCLSRCLSRIYLVSTVRAPSHIHPTLAGDRSLCFGGWLVAQAAPPPRDSGASTLRPSIGEDKRSSLDFTSYPRFSIMAIKRSSSEASYSCILRI